MVLEETIPGFSDAIIAEHILTPKDFEVELIDERIDALPEIYETDLVGITIETYTAKRAYSIAKEIRKQGIKVIMGGIHAN